MPDPEEKSVPSDAKAEQEAQTLLKMLDAELAAKRAQRQATRGDRRMTLRILALVFIIGTAVLALLALQFMLAQLPERPAERRAPAPAAP